jgi:hypothetical protein
MLNKGVYINRMKTRKWNVWRRLGEECVYKLIFILNVINI